MMLIEALEDFLKSKDVESMFNEGPAPVVTHAIKQDNVDLLKKAIERGYEITDVDIADAVDYGSLDVLEFMLSQYGEVLTYDNVWNILANLDTTIEEIKFEDEDMAEESIAAMRVFLENAPNAYVDKAAEHLNLRHYL